MNLTYDSQMFRETFESEFTWLNGFMRNVRRFSDKPAAIDPQSGRTWSYKELNADANRFANAMKKDGVKKNDIVFMQLYNSPQFLFGYIAPQKLGAISNPANFNLSPGETAEIMGHNKPVDYAPHIYDEVLRLQTSGTTGTPKGVPLNAINEVLSAHDVIMHFPLSPVDITMNMTPWFHRGGIHSGGPTPTLYAGACLVIMRTFNPRSCMDFIEKYGITFITGVPSTLEMLANRQEKHQKNLSSLKGIITMGSPLEKAACIRYQELLSPNIFNGYGTTESFWNTFLRPYDLPEMAGSAGRSCTDDEVRLVNVYDDRKAEPDDTVPCDNKTEGEIIIKCPNKTTYCYVNNEKATKDKFYKGWMYTGDIGTWNSEQFFTIAGRKDDMIISKGENIYPARIEEILNSHPKVQECIVTGVPDSTGGECVAAYVIKADESLTVAELINFCDSSPNISKYQAPRYYRFVNELPQTATGKKQHFVIKKQAAEDLKNGLLLKK